jgi:ABC-type Zn uptake system ZnuABC Zn-binding protein ZnuA
MPVTYSVTATLAKGTHVRVVNVPQDGRRMNALARYLEKPGEPALELFRNADAIVTIGKLWRDDPFFAAVRAQNIRVVNIDATAPYSATLAGVAVVQEPGGAAPWGTASDAAPAGGPSLHFWLSPSNGARMADIVAHDLMQLSPQDTKQLEQNLAAFRRALFALKNEYEDKLAQLGGVTVFALAPDFAYLTGDIGVFVDGYFVKQDIDWTSADIRSFGDYLRTRQVGVVIHKWEPNAAIQEAIRSAGATLAVLRTGEDGVTRDGKLTEDSYTADLKSNLELLHRAFATAGKTR